RNSELVDDLSLKTRVLQKAIHDWGLFIVMASVREDQEGVLREMIIESLGEEKGLDENAFEVSADTVARLVEFLLVFVTVVAVQSMLGTIHLEGTVQRALDDEDFMQSSAHAL